MMEQELLLAIKQDDVEWFSSIISKKKGVLSLCYGRFPILSLCFLYNSKSILHKYQNTLLKISSYTAAQEDLSIYKKFKKIAGKSLRYYVHQDNLVSPLEMLAILEDSISLAELYNLSPKTASIMKNITNIYRINHGQDISLEEDKIYIGKKKLPQLQRLITVIAIVISISISLLAGTLWATFSAVYGSGTAEVPYKLYTEAQLFKALKEGEKNYILAQDITLTQNHSPKNFSGQLDGKGHKITITNKVSSPLIHYLTGSLKNINFLLADVDITITEDTSFIAHTNEGTIENTHMRINGSLNEKAKEEDLFVSCFVFDNKGDMHQNNIDINIKFVGDGEKDSYFSCFASFNNGNITECITSKDSNIITDTIDVAAIVTMNEEDATISKCVNNASIKQTSPYNNWLPNASGLASNNYGRINNCFNYGDITAISTATIERLYVYVAGLVLNNYGFISKSKNDATISGQSENYHIYIGGVVCINSPGAIIDNCCSYGLIAANLPEERQNTFAIAGGICGLNSSRMHNSYSASTFSGESPNAFLGGICGEAESFISSFSNNYYIVQENITWAIATVPTIYEGTKYIRDNGTDEDTIKQQDLSQLKGKEVYWG